MIVVVSLDSGFSGFAGSAHRGKPENQHFAILEILRIKYFGNK